MRASGALFVLLFASGVVASCGGGGGGGKGGSAGTSGPAGVSGSAGTGGSTTGRGGTVGSAGTNGSAGTGGSQSGQAGQGGGAGSGPTCPTDRKLCGTECVDTTGDTRHCGGCGQACATGQVCASSACQTVGDCRQTPCPGLSYCDLSNGQCKPGCALDTQCAANETCDLTTHACGCKTGFNRCGGTCVANNSGLLACGTVCATCPTTGATTYACSGTSCVATACATGYHVCSGACVSNSSVANCGTSSCSACTVPANGAATCNGTTCGMTCNTGTLSCGGTCAVCPTGATATTCSGTSCVATACSTGTLLCGGTCAVCPTTNATAFACSGTTCVATTCTSSSYRVCGGACSACPTGNVSSTTCSGTSCVISVCVSGYHVCSGACVLSSNVATCGTSCTTCPAVANGTPACISSACSATCNTNYRLCGGVCAACPTGTNITSTTCSGSTCVVSTCLSGTHVCSGACVTNNSVATCGTTSCTPCPAPTANGVATCVSSSTCGISCSTGWARCGNDCCADCRLMSGVCTGLDWCSDINGLCAPVQKLQPDVANATTGDYFGYRVALSGTLAVVGAERDDSSAGSVYTFERQTDGKWTMQGTKLQPSTTANSYFGTPVAMSGQRLVVGAHGETTNRGAAYVFDRVGNQWVQQAKFIATADADRFGFAAAVDADRVIVGASQADEGGLTNSGAAYIFERQSDGTWPATGIKLLASNAVANTQFGIAVSIAGDQAAIAGANRAVYVFVRQADGTWTEQQILNSTSATTSDAFGTAVSIRGDRLIVGAPGEQSGAGQVWIIERGTSGMFTSWRNMAAPVLYRGPGDQFGASLSQEGDRLLVGAPGENRATTSGGTLAGAGAAYLYQRNADASWTLGVEIGSHPDDVITNRGLGGDVALSGDYVLMGAWSDMAGPPVAAIRTGTAYVANMRSVLP